MGALCCRRAGSSDEAEAARLQKLGTDHASKGEHAEALTAYSSSIRLRPGSAATWLDRSGVYQKLEDWQQALRDATRAVQLSPGLERAIYCKALALQKLRKHGEALGECDGGLAAQPRSKDLLRLREELTAEIAAIKRKEAEEKAAAAARAATEKAKAAASPKASPKAKPVAKYEPKPGVNVDYTKWANLEDSDDEKEAAKKKAEEEEKAQYAGPIRTQEERIEIVEEMLEAVKKTAKEAQVYFGKGQAAGSQRLTPDYKKPMGIMTVEQLAEYSGTNMRMLVSIYGDIYDVSHRGDLYGYGPKSHHAGKDITWGVIIGKETAPNFNRFYDIFKLDTDHLCRFLQIVCTRMVYFTEEFGDPVGRLQPYVNEQDLPPAPLDEIEECKQQ